MNNNFLTETVRFLKKSDIRLYPLETRNVKLEFENGKITKNVSMSISDAFMSAPQISNNFVLQIIVVFSTLDAKIDLLYPNLQGNSFKYKYERLPSSSDEDIILREIYRIFKILRNAATHSMDSIDISNNTINAQYVFKGTNFKLQITQMGLSLLFTYIMNLFTVDEKYSQNHNSAFNRELFDLIKQEILVIEDEFGLFLTTISENLRLKRWVRYYINNPLFDYIEQQQVLKITSPYLLESEFEKEYGADYLVKLSQNEIYLVPGELLNDQFEIEITKLLNWKL
ncbi:hypothetical protein C518_2997 [Lysinibacillus fusiformis ZB2]|nr:hypothetical protein C518_2997 [Lysinibacillus fusiformis ZB2]